jgi:nucleoside-diphosphate-sugar epimerase
MSNGRTNAVLVTGGRGFIGRQLVQRLIDAKSEKILSVDLLPADYCTETTHRIDIELDIRDRAKLQEVFTHFNISTVYDLASITNVNLAKSEYRHNVEMTQSVVECIQRFAVTKYIFFSTQFVFRKERALPASARDYYPVDAYGESKMQSEQLIHGSLPQDRWLVVRPTYIWGEGNLRFRDGFLYRLAKGHLLLPMASSVLRYYGYVRTVCEQAIKLAEHPFAELPSQMFYLSDMPIPLQEFCEYFVKALGAGRTWPVPGPFLRLLGRTGDAAKAVGLSFPINALQANEMTRSYPVPIEPTMALTGASTDYRRAAAAVVAWAISDPEFRRRIRR